MVPPTGKAGLGLLWPKPAFCGRVDAGYHGQTGQLWPGGHDLAEQLLVMPVAC
jgi:hypothetical protein